MTAFHFAAESGIGGMANAFKLAAAALRETPDRFPLFGVVNPTEADAPRIKEESERIRNIFWDFATECEEPRLVVAQAFINVAMEVGARAMGSIALAESFEGFAKAAVDPEHPAFAGETGGSAAASAER